MNGSVTLLRGNALALPLTDDSVDLVVTSPPYFGLRSYTDAGEHYAGQIGSEATPADFLGALIAATREMVRVLKPSGSIWVNLGDKYATRSAGLARSEGQVGSRPGARHDNPRRPPAYSVARTDPRPGAVRDKSLLGLPWRYALRCIDELGLILRAEVIWDKPNGLPESVTDRVRRSHEQWFHFTVQPRYFSAIDEIREKHKGAGLSDVARGLGYVRSTEGDQNGQDGTENRRGTVRAANPLGKLPGSVWTVPSQPLSVPAELGVDHFAAFPMEWPRRIIRGWCPSGICLTCGEGRRPVAVSEQQQYRIATSTGRPKQQDLTGNRSNGRNGIGYPQTISSTTITGYACACAEPTAPTRPAVVLDPFGGTGTTALVAAALGCHGVSIDMSADYCRLAGWRTADPGQRAKAAQVKKPEPVPDGLLTLMDEWSA